MLHVPCLIISRRVEWQETSTYLSWRKTFTGWNARKRKKPIISGIDGGQGQLT